MIERKAREELGVALDADFETIRANYLDLVKKYHPDRNPDDPEALKKCRTVVDAYDILCKSNHQPKTEEELRTEQYVWDLFEGFWPVSEEYKASKRIARLMSAQRNNKTKKIEGGR